MSKAASLSLEEVEAFLENLPLYDQEMLMRDLGILETECFAASLEDSKGIASSIKSMPRISCRVLKSDRGSRVSPGPPPPPKAPFEFDPVAPALRASSISAPPGPPLLTPTSTLPPHSAVRYPGPW